MAVWKALKDERGFERIQHCIFTDHCMSSEIEKLQKNLGKWAIGSTDYFGRKVQKASNVLEIHFRQYRTIAKHLQINPRSRVCFSKAVLSILMQVRDILRTGKVHEHLLVKRLKRSDHGYDKSKSTSNQYGCFAKGPISAGSVLAQYVGVWKLESFQRESEDESLSRHSLEEESHAIHADDYSFAAGHESDCSELYIDSKQRGNEATFINDGGDASFINARYIRILINGVAAIFCVAMRDIEMEEQILTKYGKRYWKARDEHNRRRANNLAGLSADPHQPPNAIADERLRPRDKPSGFYADAKARDPFPSAVEFLRSYNNEQASPFVFDLDRLPGLNNGAALKLPIFVDARESVSGESADEQLEGTKPAQSKQRKRPAPESSPSFSPSEKMKDVESEVGQTLDAPPIKAKRRRSGSGMRGKGADAGIDGASGAAADEQEAEKGGSAVRANDGGREAEEADDEMLMEDLLRGIDVNGHLGCRAAIADAIERIQALTTDAWRQELGASSSSLTQVVDELRRCAERLRRPDRVSIVLLGETGVGKSFLANLISLISAPTDETYGARLLFGPSKLGELKARVESSRPIEGELLGSLILGLEGVEDICGTLGVEPAALVESVLRGKKDRASLSKSKNVELRGFVRPTADELETEREEMRDLLRTCIEVR